MPKQPVRKRTTKAAAKPALAKPKKKLIAQEAKPAAIMPEGSGIAHMCIAGCAGRDDFGPNEQLRNIPADPQCVQTCIIDQTGKPIIITSSDTETSIDAKL
jgi:hypothetical protein